jgi:YidC/Oxa1 family membrane protein insertase
VALPVPAGGFKMLAYAGPQDFERLKAIGQELQSVNPFGWKFLQWFIRPFGAMVIDVLTWMHRTFDLAYGWVLILFGVLMRVVLFPLYQMSMRSQMKQMALQPEIKKIQEKYKDDPPKLQQEMMKAYKDGGASPLGGCLPMLLPFPVLITLFFVFQNTIEFRGVPFLWLPDLSLSDPLYIVPLLMGGSMLLLNWIGQRGMETNQQMKMFTYVLPVVFTFMFARFAAGLNLYYAASNFASLPQQLYLSRERRAHQAKTKAGTKAGGSGGSGGPTTAKASNASKGKKKPQQTPVGGKRGKGGKGGKQKP